MQEPIGRRWALPLLFLVLAAVPFVAQWLGEPFYVTLGARILIYALAALALNLVLGFAGLVSFGHAMFLGLGCYAVGILSFYGVGNGWVQLAVCIGVCALVALVVGTVCLRTSGIGFIMITLAFAQMFYFLAVSLREYGGDDGLNIYDASAFGLFDLGGSQPVYWAAWALLLAASLAMLRLRRSPFGMILRATHANPRRVDALGYSVFGVRLAAYVASGVLTGIAGLLLANLTAFASPSYMSWPVSGELIVMVVIGGLGNVLGPIFGAVAYLLLEEAFKSVTQHWMLLMGPVVVVIAMLARGGYGRSLAWLRGPRLAPADARTVTPASAAASSIHAPQAKKARINEASV
ncbi:branched-chain amino acid ABC transporter permease [Achromobacter sp. AGC25]